jgi:DNA-directed RNA polymerase specialized sigma24 family protein
VADPTLTVQLQSCLDRLRAGDAAARDELLRRAGDRLTHLTRKMLKDHARVRRWEETGDVLQNALLRLHRALGQDAPETVAGFFRLSATVIRHYGPEGWGAHHASGRHTPDGPTPPVPERADETHEPGALAMWGEFHLQVEGLPDEEREAFDLLWYQGLTQAEAAELLGVSGRTVKRRWQAARLRLFEALGGELPGV